MEILLSILIFSVPFIERKPVITTSFNFIFIWPDYTSKPHNGLPNNKIAIEGCFI
jgi:hypothetical protein